MNVLRTLFTGWPAVLTLLISPTLAVLLAPAAPNEWEQWLCVVPFLLGYLWFTWPRRPAD